MLSNRLIHTAVAYFVLGVGLGLYMGARQDFRFVHVHAHLHLLGWVSLALAGLLYAQRPALQRGWLPEAHYWLHTLGLALFMGAFAWGSATGGHPFAWIAAGATTVGLGVLAFASNVFLHLRGRPQAAA